jgi:hypothetical protein
MSNCYFSLTTRKGFSPKMWGSDFWQILHAVAWNYQSEYSFEYESRGSNTKMEEERESYKNFFKSLQYCLPCVVCCKHYKKWINNPNIDCYLDDAVFTNRKTLTYWLWSVHNCVSNDLNKKILVPYFIKNNKLHAELNKYKNANYRIGIWRENGYKTLLFVAFNYPIKKTRNNSRAFKLLFNSLNIIIPDPIERDAFEKHFDDFSNRKSLTQAVYNFYKHLGKISKSYNDICSYFGILRK